jgi:hypothetical protein
MRTTSFCQKGLLLLVAMSFASLTNQAMAQQIEWRVQLTNVGANLLAKAKVRFEDRGDRTKFDVEGEALDANLFVSVDVLLNGQLLTTAPVNGLGRFVVDWDSQDGDPVPAIQLEDIIEIADSITGATLFKGEIRSETGGGQAQRGRMRVSLSRVEATGAARAVAKYEARLNRRKFDVEGQNLSPEIMSVEVFINGALISVAPVNEFGRFTVDLDTTNGNTIPVVLEGDIVDVFDTDTGAHLFTGQLIPRSGL